MTARIKPNTTPAEVKAALMRLKQQALVRTKPADPFTRPRKTRCAMCNHRMVLETFEDCRHCGAGLIIGVIIIDDRPPHVGAITVKLPSVSYSLNWNDHNESRFLTRIGQVVKQDIIMGEGLQKLLCLV